MVTSAWWTVMAVMVAVSTAPHSLAYHVLDTSPPDIGDDTTNSQNESPPVITPWIVKALRLLPSVPLSGAADTYDFDAPEPLPAYRAAPAKRILGVELPDYIANNSRMKDLRQRMRSSG